MAFDEYPSTHHVDTPALKAWLITPHDTNEVQPVTKAVRFDEAGQVTLRTLGSQTDVVLNVLAGEVLPLRVQFIRATGTDAIAIHGFG